MEAKPQLGPQEVYAAIVGATKVDAEERRRSESTLRSWETEAAPGYIDSLLQVASQPHLVEEVWLSYQITSNAACVGNQLHSCRRESLCGGWMVLKLKMEAR